jgi:integrase
MVARQDAIDFLDALGNLHKHYGRRPGAAKLSLAELLKQFPANGQGLTNKTLNRHQSALKKAFKWFIERGIHTEPNPFTELSRPKAPLSKTTWLPFTVPELNALFAGQRFEKKPAKHSITTALPWLMAVSLFSGLREGEICELDAEDVKTRAGISYFDITAAKSEAGVRLVPVHSQLVKLGFLEYVKAIGKGPLFPGLTPGGHDKKRAHDVAKRFPKFKRDRGVTRERTVFHSFRKCFTRALEIAKIDADRAGQVVGHERGFTYRVYNPEGVDLKALRAVVEAVKYPRLKLR